MTLGSLRTMALSGAGIRLTAGGGRLGAHEGSVVLFARYGRC